MAVEGIDEPPSALIAKTVLRRRRVTGWKQLKPDLRPDEVVVAAQESAGVLDASDSRVPRVGSKRLSRLS